MASNIEQKTYRHRRNKPENSKPGMHRKHGNQKPYGQSHACKLKH